MFEYLHALGLGKRPQESPQHQHRARHVRGRHGYLQAPGRAAPELQVGRGGDHHGQPIVRIVYCPLDSGGVSLLVGPRWVYGLQRIYKGYIWILDWGPP